MFEIGNCIIGGGKTFVIAEIGSNHNQDISLARELIDAAKDCGADAVKFQSIKADELFNVADLSLQDKHLLKSIELKEEWYKDIFSYADKKGIICMSAPTYLNAVDLLIKMKVKAFKIASPQTYGFPQLIDYVAKENIPTFMSTGYCNYADIERAVNRFGRRDKLVLLHCISNYPTDSANVNLKFIKTLRCMFGTYVGYSDHTLGINTAIAAAALGIDALEKHITFSREAKGPDHHFALEINEFKNMIDGIREIEEALGDTFKKNITSFEQDYKDEFLMNCFIKRDMNEGQSLERDNIKYLRGNKSALNAWEVENYIGKQVNAIKKANQPLLSNDFK